jgi:hypothetical protein
MKSVRKVNGLLDFAGNSAPWPVNQNICTSMKFRPLAPGRMIALVRLPEGRTGAAPESGSACQA